MPIEWTLPIDWNLPMEAAIGGALVLILALVGLFRRKKVPALETEAEAEEVSPDAAPDAATFAGGMAKTRAALGAKLAGLFGRSLDEDALQELEDILISSDVGVRTAMDLVETVRQERPEDLKATLRGQMLSRLGETAPLAPLRDDGPMVILVVGVNGSGKTTTIGKLAARYAREGHSVLLGAGDTFRAGAVAQLKVWGERAGVPVISHQEGADPSAVLFDTLKAAKARDVDVVICDTAGRLQAKRALMDELGKVVRTLDKALPGAPHEVLLVLDGTIGQNALSQAREFGEVVALTGVALTKLDGTARGGVVVAIREACGVPVKLVGLGEGVDDLRDFEPEGFIDALLG